MQKVTSNADVELILERTVSKANSLIQNGSLIYQDGNTNERELFFLVQEACELEGFDRDSAELVSGHKFPDVIFFNAQIGIEIKGHRQGDRILGNSIMGSTPSLHSPVSVYLLAWNDSNSEVRWYDYFESVVGAEVTHSPRFVLKPGCGPEESLFGLGENQIGLAKEVCLGADGFKADLILSRMRVNALAKGNLPWWVSPPELEIPNAAEVAQRQLSIIKYSQLAASGERAALLKTLIVGFPALLGRSQTKYDEALVWSLLRRSVLISRDAFTAGGRQEALISSICSNKPLLLPKVLIKAKELLSSPAIIRKAEVEEMWNSPQLSFQEFQIQLKLRLMDSGIKGHSESALHDDCSCAALGSEGFKQLVVDWLLEEFDHNSVN